MSTQDAANSKSPLLVIKLDDTPWEPMGSPSKKRCIESRTNSERRRISNDIIYESPLIHLGRNKGTRVESLDDSVVVLDEPTSSPALNRPRVLISERKWPVCPDDSVIILSDNEGESKTEDIDERKNLATVLEDYLAKRDPELAEITTVKKVARNKSIFTWYPLPRKAKVVDKINTDGVQSAKRKRPRSKRRAESSIVEQQSVSIDSEDENTIPNDDSSKSNSQMEIIIVDNSPGIEVDNDIPPATISSLALAENVTNDEASSHSAASSMQRSTIGGRALESVEKPVACLQCTQETSKHKRSPAFCIDTNGDPSCLHRLDNKSKPRCKRKPRHRKRNFTRWSLEDSAKSELVETPTVVAKQPEINGIGSYYTQETTDKRPGSLRDIVIDGSNIAMAFTNGKYFSEDGLKLVIDYFKLRGHTVKVFVPQHKRSMKNTLLESLYTEGIVVFTPSRRIGGRNIVSYDDRYILDYATMCDGIVVSLDQYRDLYTEKPEWKNTIENRLLVPTFVGKCVMFPEDPLGRNGPKLEKFLRH